MARLFHRERCSMDMKAAKPIYRCLPIQSVHCFPQWEKSGLMMKLLTPFIWFFYRSLPSNLFSRAFCVRRGKQSLKLQLTNYVIMISVMMNDTSRGFKENNENYLETYKQLSLLFGLQRIFNLKCIFHEGFPPSVPATSCKTIMKLINVQTVINAINHSIDQRTCTLNLHVHIAGC